MTYILARLRVPTREHPRGGKCPSHNAEGKTMKKRFKIRLRSFTILFKYLDKMCIAERYSFNYWLLESWPDGYSTATNEDGYTTFYGHLFRKGV